MLTVLAAASPSPARAQLTTGQRIGNQIIDTRDYANLPPHLKFLADRELSIQSDLRESVRLVGVLRDRNTQTLGSSWFGLGGYQADDGSAERLKEGVADLRDTSMISVETDPLASALVAAGGDARDALALARSVADSALERLNSSQADVAGKIQAMSISSLEKPLSTQQVTQMLSDWASVAPAESATIAQNLLSDVQIHGAGTLINDRNVTVNPGDAGITGADTRVNMAGVTVDAAGTLINDRDVSINPNLFGGAAAAFDSSSPSYSGLLASNDRIKLSVPGDFSDVLDDASRPDYLIEGYSFDQLRRDWRDNRTAMERAGSSGEFEEETGGDLSAEDPSALEDHYLAGSYGDESGGTTAKIGNPRTASVGVGGGVGSTASPGTTSGSDLAGAGHSDTNVGGGDASKSKLDPPSGQTLADAGVSAAPSKPDTRTKSEASPAPEVEVAGPPASLADPKTPAPSQPSPAPQPSPQPTTAAANEREDLSALLNTAGIASDVNDQALVSLGKQATTSSNRAPAFQFGAEANPLSGSALAAKPLIISDTPNTLATAPFIPAATQGSVGLESPSALPNSTLAATVPSPASLDNPTWTIPMSPAAASFESPTQTARDAQARAAMDYMLALSSRFGKPAKGKTYTQEQRLVVALTEDRFNDFGEMSWNEVLAAAGKAEGVEKAEASARLDKAVAGDKDTLARAFVMAAGRVDSPTVSDTRKDWAREKIEEIKQQVDPSTFAAYESAYEQLKTEAQAKATGAVAGALPEVPTQGSVKGDGTAKAALSNSHAVAAAGVGGLQSGLMDKAKALANTKESKDNIEVKKLRGCNEPLIAALLADPKLNEFTKSFEFKLHELSVVSQAELLESNEVTDSDVERTLDKEASKELQRIRKDFVRLGGVVLEKIAKSDPSLCNANAASLKGRHLARAQQAIWSAGLLLLNQFGNNNPRNKGTTLSDGFDNNCLGLSPQVAEREGAYAAAVSEFFGLWNQGTTLAINSTPPCSTKATAAERLQCFNSGMSSSLDVRADMNYQLNNCRAQGSRHELSGMATLYEGGLRKRIAEAGCPVAEARLLSATDADARLQNARKLMNEKQSLKVEYPSMGVALDSCKEDVAFYRTAAALQMQPLFRGGPQKLELEKIPGGHTLKAQGGTVGGENYGSGI